MERTNNAGNKPRTDGQSRQWLYVPVAIFGVVAALFAFALTSGDPSKLPSALIGKPVPQFTFEPLAGVEGQGPPLPGFSAADLAGGQVTVVNFWASWCVPCVEEHPLLVELSEKEGIKVFGVNYKDQPDAARRFLSRYGNPFAALGTDSNGRGAIEWGVYGMPETFVVKGDGKIAYKHVGPMTRASLAEKILPAIRAAATAPPSPRAAQP